jgi:lon-related putative ATP-dependent protease
MNMVYLEGLPMKHELTVAQIHRACPPQLFDVAAGEPTGALETIIGQDRAVRALRFGLGIKSKGFNIYVAGLPGTGKTTAVKQFLEELARTKPVPPDWCYVHDFDNIDRPNAILLPPGKAGQFKADLDSLLRSVIQDIRSAFESEEYIRQQEAIIKSYEQKKQAIFETLNQQASQLGFILQASPMGLLTVPLLNGKPLSENDFMALSPADKEHISSKQQEMQGILETSIRQGKSQDKKAHEAIQELDQRVTAYTISPHIQDLSEKYGEVAEVVEYLQGVQEDIIQNRTRFKSEPSEQAEPPSPLQEPRELFLKRYQVNILVDNSKLTGAPVVLESNPTHGNLCGRIEQEARFGALTTDFTLIRKGCLHQANGGYLVLPVIDLLRNPLAWETLKRALENHEIAIEDVGEKLGLISTKSLRPEPIPLDVKVILIGPPDIYQLLMQFDEKFNELFKVKADFDSQIEWNEANLSDYGAFAHKVCNAENLIHLDSSGLARLVEHGARLVEHQNKLTTRFGEVADVIREAAYYASRAGAAFVTAEHVLMAIEERTYRSSLIQERIQEMISQGVIMIDVSGEQVGQVNGLSVFELGDIAFGQPNRITASIALGRGGVIDIEREAKLGGPIHTKGVLILSGYLAEKFAQDRPISLSARLVFEQNYSGVEGDSASSTELYALLSAISELPVKQGVAVTGSVNQKGQAQAIGGVNEKIEGFFEVCKARGLTGDQGVIIPTSNVENLMLKESVVAAVQEGKFHLWSVDSIEEGIELLTGVKAGLRSPEGGFEEGSVFARVDARMQNLADRLATFGSERD